MVVEPRRVRLLLDTNIVIMLAEVSLDPKIRDPFDRMFIAVAEQQRLQFLTTDAKLRDHPLAWRP
jgi:PIN domain nuclease of toxin-antitoxin system